MNILVTGAQFHNKGAQSLLFTVMSELRSRYDNVQIYYLPIDDPFSYAGGEYQFHLVYDDHAFSDYKQAKEDVARWFVRCTKRNIKYALRHKRNNLLRLSRVWKTIDIMVDVSGYALTSKFAHSGAFRYARHIVEAKKRNIPVILMPQSFGPFDYAPGLLEKIRLALNSADVVYAREKDGADHLAAIGVKDNVRIAPDTVLQSEEVKEKYVFVSSPSVTYPTLTTSHNVGIIPNTQLYRYGKKEDVLEMYRSIVDKLLQADKQVYIFRHSNDLAVCEDIYAMYCGNENVHLIREEMSCMAYGKFVRQFDFVVASRFHAIVHAYREGIPALILGWAIKYHDLAAICHQERYVFSGIQSTPEEGERLQAELAYLLAHSEEEKNTISTAIEQVRSRNCYDECKELFTKIV